MIPPRQTCPASSSGFSMVELLVAVAILAVLATIGISVTRTARESANLAKATQKMKDLGSAFVGYTVDSGGFLPLEDAPGPDDWTNAAKPEHSEAWYNALPRDMGSKAVGELTRHPEAFYDVAYPLFIPGAPYPKGDNKLRRPYFAVAMNSRLQRKDDEGIKEPGMIASIEEPTRTVIFLERGMPGEKPSFPGQRGFDGGAKANPRAFVARHNQKGLLLFADGHAESKAASELVSRGGQIPFPQTSVIWTMDPEDDPN